MTADPNLNWVYERVAAGKPDISDAGMVSWLVGINGDDEVVTIPELMTWINKISHQHEGALAYRLRITNPGTYTMAI